MEDKKIDDEHDEQSGLLARRLESDGYEVIAAAGDAGGSLPTLDLARTAFTRAYLRRVLELAGGNISQAARLAGSNRTDLDKLLHRYGIRPAEYKVLAGPSAGEVPAAH
jgi:DNA-binding NtrC family response regulator